jgi:hypothetical protein
MYAANAASYYFFGSTDSNWMTLTNWSTAATPFTQAPSLPGPNDDVTVTGKTIELTTGTVEINSLKLLSSSTTITTMNISAGATLIINRTTGSTFSNALHLGGVTLTNNGTISVTNSVNLQGCNAIAFRNPDYAYPESNNVLNNASGTLTASTSGQTAGSSNGYPINFMQNANGSSTLTTGGSILLTPPAGNNKGSFAINCSSTDATINGNGTISVGSQAAYAPYGLIIVSAETANTNFSLKIGENVTLNCYSANFKTNASPFYGPVTVRSTSANATFENNGTINFGGNSTAGLYVVPSNAFTSTILNKGNLNFNGEFALSAINFSGVGTAASTFTNTAGANINYNTTADQTTNKPFVAETNKKTLSYINSGTITIGSTVPLTTALSFFDSNTSFTNTATGVLTIAHGAISASGSTATPTSPVVFTNQQGGVLNLNSTINTQTLVDTKISLVNSGTINTAATNNVLYFSTGIAGTTSGVSFGNTSILNPGASETGIVNFTNSVLLKGTVNMDVNGTTTEGTDYDKIQSYTIGSNIDISNATLNLNINVADATVGSTISLIKSYEGTITGTFQNITGLPNGWIISYTTNSIELTFDNTTINSVVKNVYDLSSSVKLVNNLGVICLMGGNIRISTINGQMILNENVYPDRLVKLTRGVYIIEMITDNKSFVGKVII